MLQKYEKYIDRWLCDLVKYRHVKAAGVNGKGHISRTRGESPAGRHRRVYDAVSKRREINH